MLNKRYTTEFFYEQEDNDSDGFDGDIVHTHFNCPFCNHDYAGTSIYTYIDIGDTFQCEECRRHFKRVSDNEIEEI